jgi:thiol-disulfide isomerase/thioredoxin
MKKTLLILACFISSFALAQLPANSLGADFTVTDIDGETHNLYDILDEGKTVILDLFATWCGPCWNFAETGVLEDLQNEYPDAVFCMAIEADASTPESDIFSGALGNWTSVIDYMMADDPTGDIADDYALAYYPTIYKICPDRMVTEVGQLSSVSAFMNEVNSCSQATYSKDMKIVSYTGDGTHCGGTLQNASVQVQNYSLGATVSSFNVLTMVNGNTVNTTPWSGNLDTYETAMIDLGSISNIPDNASISFEVQYEGDMDTDNNMMPASVSGSTPSSVSVSLYIQTDNWAEETSWELLDENGNTVDSGNGLANNTNYEYDWNLKKRNHLHNRPI